MATSTQHETTQPLTQVLEASNASNIEAGEIPLIEHPAAPLNDEAQWFRQQAL